MKDTPSIRGDPRCEFGSEMSIPLHLRQPRPREPLELSQSRQKFDGRVDHDDVVASDREARWNGRDVLGRAGVMDFSGHGRQRLASRTQAWRV
ncbi:hypothetical protein FJTKL_10490 [Diaporthe vaccinii]|uniref:Uncharacterized protein n=1 Tax=Diaporthe vaccinii TaxID=105482 RepID=A0ABR4EJR6_9PEZI